MRDPRRLVAVLLMGLLISVIGATALRNPEAGDVVAERSAATVTTTTTTVAPSTTVAPPAPAEPLTRPVAVPKNPYAAEPLREIGSIEIPKIGLRHRVFEGITLRTIDHGPSHWPGSAMPGQRGNAVFAGHRVTHSKPFRNIDQLVAGDEVIFDIGGKRSVYRMTSSKIVTPKALDIVNPTPTATATLFACHPPGSAKFRYVVLLELVQDNQGSSSAAANQPQQSPGTQPPTTEPPTTAPPTTAPPQPPADGGSELPADPGL